MGKQHFRRLYSCNHPFTTAQHWAVVADYCKSGVSEVNSWSGVVICQVVHLLPGPPLSPVKSSILSAERLCYQYDTNAVLSEYRTPVLGLTLVTHYNDVIMTTMASQITSLTVVYSIVYTGVDQRSIKGPRHWPLCGEFTGTGEFPARVRWIPRTKGQ